METYTTVDNKKIYVFPNLLSKDICSNWIQKLQTYEVAIPVDKDFSSEIFNTVKESIGEFPFPVSTHRYEITIGARGNSVLEHYDNRYGNEKWKIVCYLNDVQNGGTDFKNGSDWLSVHCTIGTVVLFDISLLHRGCPLQESKMKYTVGIRLME
jgi:hypothetical protein